MYIYKRLSNCFPKWLYHFVFPPVVYESFSCFISLWKFRIVILCAEVTHYGLFGLILPLITFLWWDIYLKFFAHCFNCWFCFLLPRYKSSLYILDEFLYQIYFANNFCQYLACLFFLLKMPFEEQTFKYW